MGGTRIQVNGHGETVQETDVLQIMADEVEACNKAKGWYDVNPKVDQFMTELVNKGIVQNDDQYERIVTLAEQFFGPRTFGDDVALLHSEVSEALEAFRDHGLERWVKPMSVTDGNSARVVLSQGAPYPSECKPEGVGSEFADVLVRLLDSCKRYDVDLFAEWRAKVNFNWTRPARHGGKSL